MFGRSGNDTVSTNTPACEFWKESIRTHAQKPASSSSQSDFTGNQ